jgi:hypothetical protein
VSGDALLPALRRPAPVTIHNDGDVARQSRPIYVREQSLVARSPLDDLGEIGEHPGSFPQIAARQEFTSQNRCGILIANHFKVQSARFKVKNPVSTLSLEL